MTRKQVAVLAALIVCVFSALAGLHRHTSRYDDMISIAAARNRVDFYLVKAVVYEESWFRPSIRGAAGELGLMQVSLAAASDYAERKGGPQITEARLLEPELNLEVGCWYLRQCLERYRGAPNPELFALLRYNAGIRAEQWLKAALNQPVPPGVSPERHYLSFVDYPKTREYARRILGRAHNRNFWW